MLIIKYTLCLQNVCTWALYYLANLQKNADYRKNAGIGNIK